ncbi:MAG: 4-hydroxythreonine-4-phosphate dehydrogenase PdxA [Elusimicrobiaceae bacterium]|nr:4-hydroxythreonine-4-phosphate dehydrogenase PdxA [Elusimicrobiaceae bacterium]
MKSLVVITTGDPLGIGPEITVKALKNSRVRRACRVVVIGEPRALKQVGWTDDLGSLLAVESTCKLPAAHAPSQVGGDISFCAVQLGIKLALQKNIPLVTAPISKQSWHLAAVPFTGHTELLRQRTGSDGLMMFVSGNLRCALVTEHFALSHLPLTQQRVEKSALLFSRALKKLGIKNPKIGLCAVNPHAGDNGQFGTEENKILLPALKNLQRNGVRIGGPLPSDAAWLAHLKGQYDGLLCTYHDQALLGLKLAAKKPIVHLTAGLPFIRTSPAHGTAFDIAGQQKADPQSMVSAILFAARKN